MANSKRSVLSKEGKAKIREIAEELIENANLHPDNLPSIELDGDRALFPRWRAITEILESGASFKTRLVGVPVEIIPIAEQGPDGGDREVRQPITPDAPMSADPEN